jgi:hypothetical protein
MKRRLPKKEYTVYKMKIKVAFTTGTDILILQHQYFVGLMLIWGYM